MDAKISFTIDSGIMFNLGFGIAIIAAMAAIGYFSYKNMIKSDGGSSFFIASFVLSLISFLSWSAVRIHQSKSFDAYVSDYFVAAYKAKSIEECVLQYNRAISYIDEKSMNKGSTAIFYKSPSDSIDDWYDKVVLTKNKLNVLLNEKNNSDAPWRKVFEESGLINKNISTGKLLINHPPSISTMPFGENMFLWLVISLASLILTATLVVCKKYKINNVEENIRKNSSWVVTTVP
jgi:hypothetical protein